MVLLKEYDNPKTTQGQEGAGSPYPGNLRIHRKLETSCNQEIVMHKLKFPVKRNTNILLASN